MQSVAFIGTRKTFENREKPFVSIFSIPQSMASEKIVAYLCKLDPLTLPYQDLNGRVIQLLKTQKSVPLVAILEKQTVAITIALNPTLVNPLNPLQRTSDLVTQLQSSAPKHWVLVFDARKLMLTIWPHLIASGLYDNPKNYKPEEIWKHAQQRLANLTGRVDTETGVDIKNPNNSKIPADRYISSKGGHLNHLTYRAVRQEADPNFRRKDADGRPLEKTISHKGEVLKELTAARKIKIDLLDALNKRQDLGAQREKIRQTMTRTSHVIEEGKRNIKYNPKEERPDDPPPDGGSRNKPPRNNPPKGGGGQPGPGKRQFGQDLDATGTGKSYDSLHPHNPSGGRNLVGKDIGGVACSIDYFEGLFDTPESLFEQEHYFCLPKLADGQIPFSNEELKQLIRELAIGIYGHGTVPFFSLHFNQNSDLFPVIHPFYEKTLVGRVISMLDYFMKGYLNGGTFQEEFIDNWHQNPDWKAQSESALRQLIDFEEYCKTHLQNEDREYFSLHTLKESFKGKMGEILESLGVFDLAVDEPAIFRDYTEFSNSFRIIAKQNSIQKADSLFVIDADFDVLYTIKPSPKYQEALDHHMREHGQYPRSYLSLVAAFEIFAKRIHNHMVKLPLCKKYFSMLAVINFLSGYFSTLKKHRKIPVFQSFEKLPVKGSPPLFPHLPLKPIREEKLQFILRDIAYQLFHTEAFENHVLLLLRLSFDEKLRRRSVSQQEYQQSLARVLNFFQRTLKDQVLELASRPAKTFIMTNQDEFQQVFDKVGQDLFEGIEEALKTIFQANFNLLDSSQALAFAGRAAEQEEFIREILKHILDEIPNSLQDLLEFPSRTLRIPSELTVEEVTVTKRVWGGTVQKLEPMAVEPSPQGKEIWLKNWPKLEGLTSERWKRLKKDPLDHSRGAVFCLPFEEMPLGFDPYVWIESIFEESEKTPWDMALDAMNQNDIIQFEQCITENRALLEKQDSAGKTLMHYAAMHENLAFTEFLLNIRKG